MSSEKMQEKAKLKALLLGSSNFFLYLCLMERFKSISNLLPIVDEIIDTMTIYNKDITQITKAVCHSLQTTKVRLTFYQWALIGQYITTKIDIYD